MVFGTITIDPTSLDWVTLVSAILSLTCLFCFRRGGPVEGYVVCGDPTSKLRKVLSRMMDYQVYITIIFIAIAISCFAYQGWNYFH